MRRDLIELLPKRSYLVNAAFILTLSGLSTIAISGTMGSVSTAPAIKPVVAVQGGYAALGASNSTRSFTGTDDNVFTYKLSSTNQDTGFGGFFVGIEHELPLLLRLPQGYFFQAGVEYNYFGSGKLKGLNGVGIEPITSTIYNYQYNNQSQQVLAALRILGITHQRFHLYGEVGLGAAFNKSSDYFATTSETGSINLTPTYSGQSRSDFSYALGLGLDMELTAHLRASLGYRYTNFGAGSLNDGAVVFNQYRYPVSFNPASSHLDANLLLARISYVV